MKRAISMLGALALMAVGFLFAAPAAHATVIESYGGIDCELYPDPPLANTPVSNIKNWPRIKETGSSPSKSHAYYCGDSGSPDSQFHTMWQAAQTVGQKGSTSNPDYMANIYFTAKQRVYLFEDLADLNAHWGTSYSGSDIVGVTLASGDGATNPNIPIGSVGILRTKGGSVNSFNTIKSATYHELGHAFDKIKGFPSNGPGSTNWNTAKSNDIFQLNATGSGTADQGRANVFNGIDVQNDYPAACWTKYQAYTTYTHWEVAKCMWPYETSEPEFFANVFAARVGGITNGATSGKQLDWKLWLGNKLADEVYDYMDDIVDGNTP